MRNKYVMTLAKDGYMKYISHLDMIRLFKNAFKRAGIKLVYSQGFNPHPKMNFAQPLPLGYASSCEIIEFELKDDSAPEAILNAIAAVMPKGIEILGCTRTEETKSVTARTFAADYEITMPISSASAYKEIIPAQNTSRNRLDEAIENFLNRESITVYKYQKKTNTKREINIRPMIRTVSGRMVDDKLIMYTKLDSGSGSNLSPELLISAFVSFVGIDVAREEIEVKRTGLFFD